MLITLSEVNRIKCQVSENSPGASGITGGVDHSVRENKPDSPPMFFVFGQMCPIIAVVESGRFSVIKFYSKYRKQIHVLILCDR
jgi:hypothetical protein